VELKIEIEDYNYDLPEEKIAKFPLDKRDSSKILIYKDRLISETQFTNLPELIPDSSVMVFNSTKVVPARLIFRRDSGARIEIFCLEPYSPSEYIRSFASVGSCEWIVAIGNAKRWKDGELLFETHGVGEVVNIDLRVSMVKKREEDYIVQFRWNGGIPFSYLLELCGNIPIPPYLKRESQAVDLERYQTLYAKERGSVAAPTAGLHFSEKVLKELNFRGIGIEELTLHVGAGTFRPVKSKYITDHKMHSEPFTVSRKFLVNLLESIESERSIIAVGTTSIRVLESLYYVGRQISRSGEPGEIKQWEPYADSHIFIETNDVDVSAKNAIKEIIKWMDCHGMESYKGRTEIIIVPGYRFKIADTLITNFHQPQSTLLLLVSAFIGDSWKSVYKYAIDNNFRFLSYGDSSILFCNREKM